jgi:hypothetical protein
MVRILMARQADIALTTTDDFQFGVDDSGYSFDLDPSGGIVSTSRSAIFCWTRTLPPYGPPSTGADAIHPPE